MDGPKKIGIGATGDDNWQKPTAGPVLFGDTGEGWILTSSQLFRLRDQGRSWTPVFKNQENQAYYSFTFTSPEVGFVVGSQNVGGHRSILILQTNDGGRNWQESPTDFEPNTDRNSPALYSISFCGQESGWAVGDGLIMHSNNAGRSWVTQRWDVADDARLVSVDCYDNLRATAVGAGGFIVRTDDAGKLWRRQNAGTMENLMRIRVFGRTAWIVGGSPGRSLLLRSNDQGLSWQPQSVDSAAGLFDIFLKDKQGWIAGEKGVISHTNDGGLTWTQEKSPTTENLTSLFFLSANNGWAAGDKGTLLHFSSQ